MLANRVSKRYKHLRKWARRLGLEAFRLYDRDIPEIPLVLDFYNGVISGALYKRPYEKDPALESIWINSMKNSLSQSLEIAPENIIIKQREKKHGEDQYEKIAEQGLVYEIREGKYKFKVNLSDYLDTGLFLDRRALRQMVESDANGKQVLNLFCYTASFSIYAAGGGAVSTDSVDLSNTYLSWARDNFSLNGFKAERLRLEEFVATSGYNNTVSDSTQCRNRLIRADVNAFLEQSLAARRSNEARFSWDSIIVDPPAFSNSTMARADFDLKKDYESLLAKCLALLSPDGKLWFSANARSFKAAACDLEKTLCGQFPGIKVVDITNKIVDEDFKGKKGPKTFVMGYGV
jgi:23S rRNA G2069 N7-methylase RlmK/C1962 C5-methylase RlmI